MAHFFGKNELAIFGMSLTRQVEREKIAAKIHPHNATFPTQAFGQAEVDQLLNFLIGRAGVGRPVKSGDNLASLDADEIVPKFDAVAIVVLGDDEGAEGSVDVECGFVFVHVYKVAQITRKTRDFFAIVQIIFVDEKKFCRLAHFLNA